MPLVYSFPWGEPHDPLEKPTWMMGLNHCVNEIVKKLRSFRDEEPLLVDTCEKMPWHHGF